MNISTGICFLHAVDYSKVLAVDVAVLVIVLGPEFCLGFCMENNRVKRSLPKQDKVHPHDSRRQLIVITPKTNSLGRRRRHRIHPCQRMNASYFNIYLSCGPQGAIGFGFSPGELFWRSQHLENTLHFFAIRHKERSMATKTHGTRS